MQNLDQRLIESWLQEDGWGELSPYWSSLPQVPAQCEIRIKSKLILAGIPWLIAVFDKLSAGLGKQLVGLNKLEGTEQLPGSVILLPAMIPWGVALTGERLSLNILHRASAVATATRSLVKIASQAGIAVLDTRKTTPGLRGLEKYAVSVGGGSNHRFSQTDTWMIKDNHKQLMGLKGAIEFFQSLRQPYKNLVVEIHETSELEIARTMGVRFFLLDNFSPNDLEKICQDKGAGEYFEISGGINLSNIANYLIPGVDAISSGFITQFPAAVDMSFKFQAESK